MGSSPRISGSIGTLVHVISKTSMFRHNMNIHMYLCTECVPSVLCEYKSLLSIYRSHNFNCPSMPILSDEPRKQLHRYQRNTSVIISEIYRYKTNSILQEIILTWGKPKRSSSRQPHKLLSVAKKSECMLLVINCIVPSADDPLSTWIISPYESSG